MKKILYYVELVILLSLAIGLGYLLKEASMNLLGSLMAATVILLVMMFLMNVILHFHLKKKYASSRLKEFIEQFRDQSEKDILNYDKSMKHMNRLYLLSKVYLGLLILLSLLIVSFPFAMSLKEGSTEGYIPWILISFYILFSLFYSFAKSVQKFNEVILSRRDYPKLYGIIDSVRNELDYQKEIHAMIRNDNNVFISFYQNEYYLGIGILPLLMLDEIELKSVIYHEMGHIIYKDTYRLAKRSLFLDQLEVIASESGVLAVSNLFLFGISAYLSNEFTLHNLIISKTQELRSDEVVKSKGLHQEYISAGIKIACMQLYINDIDSKYNTLENETISEQFYDDIVSAFLSVIESKKEKYFYFIEHELDSKRNSHPTLHTRMENFGVSKIQLNPFSNYDEEEVASIKENFQKVTEEQRKQYFQNRKQFYLTWINQVKEFEANPKDDLGENLRYVENLLNLYRLDQAYEKINELLIRFPDTAQVLYYASILELRYKNNEIGVSYLEKAAKLNRNFIDSIDLIATFAIRNGRKDILDTIREQFLTMKQEGINSGYEDIKITQLAQTRKEPWIKRYGNKISSEWMLPKVAETLHRNEKVFKATAFFLEAGDYINYYLTGVRKRSSCGAGYKGIWNDEEEYPNNEFLNELDPLLHDIYHTKLSGPVLSIGETHGYLKKELAQKYGLKEIPIGISVIDAHVAAPACQAVNSGDMLMILGTSSCDIVLSNKEVFIPGIQGVVKNGVIPNLYAYESGQPAVGDIFSWYIEKHLPEEVLLEAKSKQYNKYQIMEDRVKKIPKEKPRLLALDWWNGNRSVLVDPDLSGLLIGYNLQTTPEDIYRALIEATAFGKKMTVDAYENSGVPIERVIACGGLATKNQFLLQTYANILDKPIYYTKEEYAPALGAAIFGSLSAKDKGGYSSMQEATHFMSKLETEPIYPNHEYDYEPLYEMYKELHDYFGKQSDLMKKLRKS